jgi:L-ascorbate metabolism protein UlaG (beta-lactamase superfamily)
MRVRYLGHAAFLLDDGDTAVVLDPYLDISDSPSPDRRWDYPEIEGVDADLLLISHDHGDHNNPDAIGGRPLLIRSRAGRFKTPLGEVVGVNSDHDAEAGSLRGANTIFVFTLGGLRVCHLGDFGQRALRDEQAEAIGAIDLLLVGVGGGSTSSPQETAGVVERIGARWVLPMHYKTRYVDFMEPVDTFLELVGSVHPIDSSEFDTAELPDSDGQIFIVPAVP